jgi:pimeloyl-ACP methyl ester carboxylesterase
MNKVTIAMISLILTAVCISGFAQTKTGAFEVTKSGEGTKSLILIPGFGCPGDVWMETISKFKQDYTCYSLTMAGFAGAAPQPNSSFKNWETGIANYIREHKLYKPTIIGHSMGGALALALASDYPDLVEKIVVVDALPCLSALMNPAFKSEEKPDCSALVNQMTSATNEQFYQMQKMSIPRLLEDTSMRETVIGWTVKSDRKTFAVMYCDFSNTDLREKIKNIKCPAYILLEQQFKNIQPTIQEQYKNLTNASLRYANKGQHFIMYDDKDLYFQQLNSIIK